MEDTSRIHLAIYINNGRSNERWVDHILDGSKTIETRTGRAWRNFRRVLEKYGDWRNQRVAFVFLKRPYFTADLVDVKEYGTREEFDADIKSHLVFDGSSVYDNSKPGLGWDDANKRVGLVLKNVKKLGDRPELNLGPGAKSYLDLEKRCIEIVDD